MNKITHLVNFGFGEIAVAKINHTFKVIKSDDPMMPVDTVFPLKDIKILDADLIELY